MFLSFIAVILCVTERCAAQQECECGSLQWKATDIAAVTFTAAGQSKRSADIIIPQARLENLDVDQVTGLQLVASVVGSVLKLDAGLSAASSTKV